MRLVGLVPLASLLACGSVEQDAADGSAGAQADASVNDAGEPDAQSASPGDLRWALSLSAMSGYGIADGPGGLIVTGSITAPAELGDDVLIPRSANDMVIAGVRSSDASFLYTAQHGARGGGAGYGFLDHADSGGNAMAYGVSYGDVDLGRGVVPGGGGGTDPASPPADGFIGRYGPGAPAWILRAVGPGEDKILTTAPAQGSKLYAAGWFEETTAIGGQSYPTSGGRDLLLTRLNTFTGATDFVRTYGGLGRDEISGAAGDGASLILGGFFDDTLAFDANVEVTATGGGLDVWVAKFDSDANPVWAVSFGGSADDRGAVVAMDQAGDIYVAGQFRDEIAFGAVNLTARGQGDIFVAKLDGADGDVAWAIAIGTDGEDGPGAIAFDGAGHVVVAGTIGGPLDDEPALGGVEALLVSLDDTANGATRWRKVISTSGADYAWDVTVGTSGDLFAIINLGGPFDFGIPIIGPPNPAGVLLRIAP